MSLSTQSKNILLYGALFVPAVLWRSFVAVHVWAWYAPSDWHQLTLVEGVGVFLATSLLAAVPRRSSLDEFDPLGVIADSVVGPGIALLFAFAMRGLFSA